MIINAKDSEKYYCRSVIVLKTHSNQLTDNNNQLQYASFTSPHLSHFNYKKKEKSYSQEEEKSLEFSHQFQFHSP